MTAPATPTASVATISTSAPSLHPPNCSPPQNPPISTPLSTGTETIRAVSAPTPLQAPLFKLSKRNQVKKACVNCQKACKKCDDCRPCYRCHRLGIQATCVDSARKERTKSAGRPKRGPWTYISPATGDRTPNADSQLTDTTNGVTAEVDCSAGARSASSPVKPSTFSSHAIDTNMDISYQKPQQIGQQLSPPFHRARTFQQESSPFSQLHANNGFDQRYPTRCTQEPDEMRQSHHQAAHLSPQSLFPLPQSIDRESSLGSLHRHVDHNQTAHHLPFLQPQAYGQRSFPSAFNHVSSGHYLVAHQEFGRFRTTSVVSTLSSIGDTDDRNASFKQEADDVDWYNDAQRGDKQHTTLKSTTFDRVDNTENESSLSSDLMGSIGSVSGESRSYETESNGFTLSKLDVLSRLCDVVLTDSRSADLPLLVPLIPHSSQGSHTAHQSESKSCVLNTCSSLSTFPSYTEPAHPSWIPSVQSSAGLYTPQRPLSTVHSISTSKFLDYLVPPCSTTPPATPITTDTSNGTFPSMLSANSVDSNDITYSQPSLTWDNKPFGRQYSNATRTTV
ncbi:hypothetical protein BATDEDRAFT_22257 [Batrachochytrium dendrobatidis JAM81]|uniref:Zn(2)-C6 fungal-type domain-containing protein n=3 Tax=Batrachochytrium dendrobatidis TaxID=109871 RepID=F4NTB8_BATDJ|nr:uncharacterized protein BATDEDRAFT_22257 [Batrachochytrium dendrobatidis JAM81]EGF84322.1 hypothetical protein BATDEDRAFT_22257 [Batrachochytrium dendrobatidis JAM81]OAJ37192.1 hypothetical protein BDEG_21251 [Batrachochytrium dendrobatidis JEL423]|eukprot:XP_006675513.1 hypothetical protein BATDEDRAFT_22257 [Batrachochytrium dendrobatidis JAM81]